MKNNWQTKKFNIYIPLTILGVIIVVGIFEFSQFSAQLNLMAIIATLSVLIWYTWETKNIREQAVLQTELTTMPVMSLYIRRVNNIEIGRKREQIKQYAITQEAGNAIVPSLFYIALRNMGNGPAFNVNIVSDNLKAEKYQTRFFEQNGDEHAVKMIKKPSNKIRDLKELNGEIFTIKCQSVLGRRYEYKYKINDTKEKSVEYIK